MKILVLILKFSQVLKVGNQFTVFFKMSRESNKAELPLGAKVLQHDLKKTELTLHLACSFIHSSLLPSILWASHGFRHLWSAFCLPDTSEAWDLPKEITALALGISYSNGVQAAYSFIKLQHNMPLWRRRDISGLHKGDELPLGFERWAESFFLFII